MYCVRFKGSDCTVGYIRPWNSVREGETYSLTYLPTSFINGIEKEHGCEGEILRHKLRFNGMTKELFESEETNGIVIRENRGRKKYKALKTRNKTISTIHQLSCPEIILGFEKLEDAENAAENYLYVGQTQYMIFPVPFDDETDDVVIELSEEEFSELSGTETFASTEDDEDAVYCGNNRQNNNEKMFIRIVRTK
jgi:hypothetical protein